MELNLTNLEIGEEDVEGQRVANFTAWFGRHRFGLTVPIGASRLMVARQLSMLATAIAAPQFPMQGEPPKLHLEPPEMSPPANQGPPS